MELNLIHENWYDLLSDRYLSISEAIKYLSLSGIDEFKHLIDTHQIRPKYFVDAKPFFSHEQIHMHRVLYIVGLKSC